MLPLAELGFIVQQEGGGGSGQAVWTEFRAVAEAVRELQGAFRELAEQATSLQGQGMVPNPPPGIPSDAAGVPALLAHNKKPSGWGLQSPLA
jgi:hypothetical protein